MNDHVWKYHLVDVLPHFKVYTNSVYIADIHNTTVSSGAMFGPPMTRLYSQLFPGVGVAPSDPDFWTPAVPGPVDPASVSCQRAVAVQKISETTVKRRKSSSMLPGVGDTGK
jgi:hypothetical protein